MAGEGDNKKELSTAIDGLIPTHVIVHQQFQDIIRLQSSLAMRLRYKVDKKDDFVPQEDYVAVLQELEEEKLQHLKTKAKLSATEQKLQFSLHEIDALHQELNSEKELFQNAFGSLKEKAKVQGKENEALVDKCIEMEKLCSHQDDVLATKDSRIRDLKSRLAKQKNYHKTQLSEVDVTLQQERYLAQNVMPILVDRKKLPARTVATKPINKKVTIRTSKT